ncbi:mechanosensitive ion channel family protein [Sulfurospirillum sp. 1612]|uniref:mechanosensitive ion channel family protein n=1 Tax=Sulfurospirillum sp. 1612 TaxID=3094835 RepID=UPI002F93BA16
MNINTLLHYTIFQMSVQNILISIGIFGIALLTSNLFSKLTIRLLQRMTQKTKSKADDKLLSIIEAPLRMSIILFGFYLAKEWLKVPKLDLFLNGVIKTFVTIIIFWILYKLVHKFSYILSKFSSKFGREMGDDIKNFIIKTLKIFIIIIGSMSVLQGWGINVSAFIASLGLVGMAFALAAKDTAANLFGSLVIFTDRPFKVGDWIQTPDVQGIVERIGIRSTKVRDFAQALTSVPNAIIANSAIINWSKMGKRRIKMRIGLTYDTSSEQMQKILDEIREMLNNHEGVHKGLIMVNFDEFEDSALSIFCYFFTITTNWKTFLATREDINLKIMKIVEENKASFAFPSQSLYIESLPKTTEATL